jgi:hypothetical protein
VKTVKRDIFTRALLLLSSRLKEDGNDKTIARAEMISQVKGDVFLRN